MKRYFALAIAVLVLTLASIPALAATDKIHVDKDLAALYEQMISLRRQILDKRVELGQITKEQAESAKDHLDEVYEWHKENGFQYGPGHGMGSGYCHGKPGGGHGFRLGPARWGN
ncbi:MAG: YckD family protein [Firmicutes bacterium]|nr:YckD family protein [Bacillota bacterium]